MLELFHTLYDYQLWVYGILGILALLYLKRLISAWQERYATIFGLEREAAQRRLNSALAVFVLLLLLIGAEFVLVTFILPEWPQVMFTASPTPETAAEEEEFMITRPEGESSLVVAATPEGASSGTAVPANLSGGCIKDQLEWLEPEYGEVISGSYILNATVNVRDMAFFEWAYAPVDDAENWTVLSAGNLPVLEGELGLWATTQVANGDYVLRITVYGLDNQALEPCDVHIRVLNEAE